MTQGVAFAEANLNQPDTGRTWNKVQVSVRGTTLTIRDQAGTIVDTIDGVAGVAKTGRHKWVVRFEDGLQPITLERTNCGCG